MVARAPGTPPEPPADVGPTAAVHAGTLTLLRHGESESNRAGRFTGWSDVDLTATGAAQAAQAGAALRAAGIAVDHCFTSTLHRATESARITLEAMDRADVPRERSWRLNERHYGAFQGLGLWEAIRRFGILSVLRARRQYDYRPPPLAEADDDAPRTESLADLRARVSPYWREQIAPLLADGRSVLVVSHRHALRALFATLARQPGTAALRVPTGVPIVLSLDRTLAPVAHRTLRLPSRA